MQNLRSRDAISGILATPIPSARHIIEDGENILEVLHQDSVQDATETRSGGGASRNLMHLMASMSQQLENFHDESDMGPALHAARQVAYWSSVFVSMVSSDAATTCTSSTMSVSHTVSNQLIHSVPTTSLIVPATATSPYVTTSSLASTTLSTLPYAATSTLAYATLSTIPQTTSCSFRHATSSTLSQATSSTLSQATSSTLPPATSNLPQATLSTLPQATLSTLPQATLSTPPQATISTLPQATISTLPQTTISTLPPATSNLPHATISTLPQTTLSTLPQATISTLPQATISTLPQATISTLPPATSNLPQATISTLPQTTLSTLPPTTLSTLPPVTLSNLPQATLSAPPIPSHQPTNNSMSAINSSNQSTASIIITDPATIQIFREYRYGSGSLTEWLHSLKIPRNVDSLQQVKELWECGAINCPPLCKWTVVMRNHRSPNGVKNSSVFSQRKFMYNLFKNNNFDENVISAKYSEVKPGKLYKILNSKNK